MAKSEFSAQISLIFSAKSELASSLEGLIEGENNDREINENWFNELDAETKAGYCGKSYIDTIKKCDMKIRWIEKLLSTLATLE